MVVVAVVQQLLRVSARQAAAAVGVEEGGRSPRRRRRRVGVGVDVAVGRCRSWVDVVVLVECHRSRPFFIQTHERARQSASSSVTRETQEGETEKENSDVIEGQRDCVVSTIYHRD